MKHAILLSLMLLFVSSAFAYPDHVPSAYAYDPPQERTCHNCHSSYPLNSGTGDLTITPLAEYTPGQSYTIQVQLSDNVSRSGFQATAKDLSNQFAGQIYVVDAAHTQMTGGTYINHTQAGNHSGNSWDIGWTAPAAGTGDVRFCVASAACNGNGGTSGDYIYGIQVIIPEAAADPCGLTTTGINTVIPAQGGNVTYSIDFFTNLPQSFPGVTYWTTITLPNGTETGVQTSITTTIPAFANIHIPMMTQAIPSFAPAGQYVHNAKLGMFPVPVLMDSFTFTKTAVSTDGIPVYDWNATGEWPEIASDNEGVAELPVEYTLNAAYPNPFNAMTTISVTLPETSELSMNVFNLMGEVVSELSNGKISAGTHEFSFDATNFSSGIYFVQANVPGKLNAIQKITLIK